MKRKYYKATNRNAEKTVLALLLLLGLSAFIVNLAFETREELNLNPNASFTTTQNAPIKD